MSRGPPGVGCGLGLAAPGPKAIDRVAWMSTGGARAGSASIVLQNHGGQGISATVRAHSCGCVQGGFGADGLMRWKTQSRAGRSALALRAVVRSVDEAAEENAYCPHFTVPIYPPCLDEVDRTRLNPPRARSYPSLQESR